MALTNRERVGRMLDLLGKGLRPIVGREFAKAYGADWIDRVAAEKEMATGFATAPNPDDVQFLLNSVWFHWKETLGRTLGAAERSYVSELRDARNRWAHPSEAKPFTTDDVYRAFDTAERLLRSVSAPEADELSRAKLAILREGYEAAAKQQVRRSAATAVAGEPLANVRAWRDVIDPHPDVARGLYRQAEFAADLAQVDRGEGDREYADPREFFARTYLTEGLRLLLTSALRRLAGSGGESVIELQTTFGGGKTHSMLALYHLVDPKVDLQALPGIEPVLEASGVHALPRVRRAVIVGNALSPVAPRVVDGQEIRTLWGELGWRLGASAGSPAEGYALVAEADQAGVSPGADRLRELLGRYAPCLILVDEWVTYTRLLHGIEGLPGGSFDAALSFAQALTTAADQVPGALLVVSLPSSEIEVGGAGGHKALDALKHVVHRMNAPWKPAAAQESFEIVRRRLFDELPAENVRARDEAVQRFSELYAANDRTFPSETKEKPYLDRMRACYPIHPELFDRLFNDWSTLERFQRTRGVLKLMAAVIHALWVREDRSLLVLPSSVPLDDPGVLAQLTQYLDDGWSPVVESDVDGATSLPIRLDTENTALGRYSAARRVARTVFMGSAPLPAAANRGLDAARVFLGSVQPGEAPATFGDALRRLAGQATYLYENASRYWYATQPSVNQVARDRAEQQTVDAVHEEIEKRVRAAVASDRGPFARIHACPQSASDVPDEDEAALVVLGPQHPHDAKGDSRAVKAAAAILAERGTGPRTNRNMLVFLAPDATRLAELEAGVRVFLAWKSIVTDGESGKLNLDTFQRTQAASQRKTADETVAARIPETYHWALVPEQPEATVGEIAWRSIRVTGGDPLAVRTGKRLVADELLVTRYGGVNLRLILDRYPDMWRDGYVSMRQLWAWFASYLYLPRFRDRSVLEAAVADGVSAMLWRSETFAYAAAREEAGEYRGLVAGEPAETRISATAVLVRPDTLPDPLHGPVPGPQPPGPVGPGPVGPGPFSPGPTPPVGPAHPVRFHGSVSLADPRRPLPELQKIAQEIITPLAMVTEVSLRVRVEIEAEHKGADGFEPTTERTVSENARTLRFSDFGFEKE